MENNKNKKSVKFQGDMLNFCDFIQVFVFTRNHHLKFNGENYYQCRGVAMGHKASPAICDIVIYYLEERILALAEDKIFKWLRFRDDVFAIYIGEIEKARYFLKKANEMHSTLKFKYEISHTQGVFLDTVVFKGKRFESENILDFKPYVKPTEKFQYIHRQSSHPKSVFSGLIKGELMRFVRTATNSEDYVARADLFKQKLLLRGYGENEFQSAYSQVHHGQREEYLKGKTKHAKKINHWCLQQHITHISVASLGPSHVTGKLSANIRNSVKYSQKLR